MLFFSFSCFSLAFSVLVLVVDVTAIVVVSWTDPGSPDSNYLRVAQSLAGRRLSDNGIVSGGGGNGRRGVDPVVSYHGARDRPAPSSTSSAYLSPATCLSVGSLPTRRHSSIGSTDRRPSNANLIPPSVFDNHL